MKILVTGGAGFIGSNIVRELVNRGDEVVVIDNLFSGKKENLTEVMDSIRFVEGSITDFNLLKEECKGVDVILHQTAIPSVPRSINDPLSSNTTNIEGSLKVLLAAKECSVKRVVLAGSSSAYGNTETLPKTEDMPTNPLSPYALQKVTSEVYAKLFNKLFNLDTVVLRYFNVFGPRQNKKGGYAAAIPLFISAILEDKSPVIFGDGLQSRDFTFVDNVVHANILAAIAEEPLNGEVINVACGERITLLELVEKINKVLGKDIKPVLQPTRLGDVKHSLASIEKAKQLLNFEPQVLFDEGLEKTIEWYKEN
tara:strand:+ start:6974 stop:7906 length:933 start_codon:yes stop_codon:yes gene_type:complete